MTQSGPEPLGSVFAPAKINLALHVTGRRADFYHLLDSLVVFAGIGDRIEAFAGDGGAPLMLAGPFAAGLAAEGDNLVVRAERLVRRLRPDLRPLALRLTKELPLSSGIGGGSADGAATLRLLAALAGGIEEEALAALAGELGADGPMCLASAPLRARGIGEAIEPLPELPRLDLVLVNPGVAVSTPAVFRRLTQRDNPGLPDPLPRFSGAAALAAYLAEQTRNDLEPPAIAEAGVIAEAKAALAACEGCLLARMSGSGATVFGLFADAAHANRGAEAIAAAHPDWWVRAAPTIAREQAMPRGLGQTV